MANRIISGKNPKIVIPSFPIERVFHERQLRASINAKVEKIDELRAALQSRVEKTVDISHCLVGEEEMLLVSCGDTDGVAISVADLGSGKVSLQQVCESVM